MKNTRSTLLCGFFLLLVTLVVSCHKSPPAWKQHAFKEEDRSTSPIQRELPRSLWQKMTAVLGAEASQGKGEHGGSEHGAEKSSGGASSGVPLPSIFEPIKVYLVENTPGVLQRGNTAVSFAVGGGTLDLHDFVKSRAGSFSFVAEFAPELEGVTPRVFFLSNSEIRDFSARGSSSKAKESFGSGCNTYFEITSKFNKAMKGNGLVVDIAGGRDVSALAGTYYFVAAAEKKLYVASLTVKDSSQPRLLCRRD